MAKNRMTFEKHHRDAMKKRKAEEKRTAKRKRKELAQSEAAAPIDPPLSDEAIEEEPR